MFNATSIIFNITLYITYSNQINCCITLIFEDVDAVDKGIVDGFTEIVKQFPNDDIQWPGFTEHSDRRVALKYN